MNYSGIKIDLIKIIQPYLIKVKEVCKESTPSLEMLNFLKTVLADITPKIVHKNQQLRQFLMEFMIIFCNKIPHNLHDEVFQVAQNLIDLLKHYLTSEHYINLIEALVDKYTMRSKAYKTLYKKFLLLIIEQSQKKFDKVVNEDKIYKFVIKYLRSKNLLKEDGVVIMANVPQMQQMVQQHERSHTNQSQINNNFTDLISTSQDDLDNYVYEDQESGTHVLDDEIDGADLRLLNLQQ